MGSQDLRLASTESGSANAEMKRNITQRLDDAEIPRKVVGVATQGGSLFVVWWLPSSCQVSPRLHPRRLSP